MIDERFDIELLAKVAEMRPDWSFVMVGPVVKISEDELPQRHNIHYLGGKTYEQLPAYLSGWDVALMPFAMNESTAVHLADQDAGISRGRQAGRIDAGQGRRSSLRRISKACRSHRRAEEFVAGCEKALELSRKPDERLARGGRSDAFRDELGHDPGAHGGPDRTSCSATRAGRHAGAAGGRGMSALMRRADTASATII